MLLILLFHQVEGVFTWKHLSNIFFIFLKFWISLHFSNSVVLIIWVSWHNKTNLLILKQSCKVLEIFFLLKCYFCCFWYILKLWNECCQKVGFRWIWHNVIKKPPTKIVLTLTHDILNFVMNRLWCIHWMYAITFYFLLY